MLESTESHGAALRNLNPKSSTSLIQVTPVFGYFQRSGSDFLQQFWKRDVSGSKETGDADASLVLILSHSTWGQDILCAVRICSWLLRVGNLQSIITVMDGFVLCLPPVGYSTPLFQHSFSNTFRTRRRLCDTWHGYNLMLPEILASLVK